MKKIYIAGPYDGKNVIEILGNIRRGIKAAAHLMKRGYAVYCPFLDFLISFVVPETAEIPKEIYQKNSLAWIDGCDAVLLLPGWEKSNGVKRELELARSLGITSFVDYIPEGF